jgi:PD-(D/E)XK endonuclease
MTPDQKGDIAESSITAAAVRLGIGVLKPLTDGHRYDLAFDLGWRMLRVQCKWAAYGKGVVIIRSYTSRRAPEGFRWTTCTPDEIDAVAGYCADLDRCFLLPVERVVGHRQLQLRIDPPKNNQRLGINFADLYDFSAIDWSPLGQFGAVAQLEERRHGMAEVRGSSPLSSTQEAARGAAFFMPRNSG